VECCVTIIEGGKGVVDDSGVRLGEGGR
jgi:hypothetical protein